MLPKFVEWTRPVGPIDFLSWLVAAAIVTIVAISAAVFIADCICEWKSSAEPSPNNPFCGMISRRPKMRRSLGLA